jgi:hypothetical protein
LIYIFFSFHRHSMCVFLHYSYMFLPCGGTWVSFLILAVSSRSLAPSFYKFHFPFLFF